MKLTDIKIAGAGTINDGEYGNINISGSVKIIGNIKCEKLSVSGACKAAENVVSKDITINGNYKCHQKTTSDRMIINGSGKFNEMQAGKVEVNGKGEIENSLSFDKANIKGVLKVAKQCEGNEFWVDGVVNIEGMLSADRIEIRLRNKCKIKQIGGEKVIILNSKYKSRKFLSFNWSAKPRLESEEIEGDEVTLESTYCKVVRGDKVIIGKGCVIDTVEYKTSIAIDKNSIVKNTQII